MRNSHTLAAELSGPVSGSLRKSATRGAMWTTVQSLINRFSGVIVFLALARLLAPAEFGVLAAAQVFIALATTFAEAGLTRTLVQRPILRAAHLDVALLVSTVSGLALGGGLAVAAPMIANLYDMPALSAVLMALAVVPLLNGISGVPDSILRRQLRFRSLALRSSSSVVVGGTVGVVLASVGAGVWALVAQATSQALVATVVLWASARWRPSMVWDREAFTDLLGFGSHVLGISFLNFVNRRSGEFLIGLTLGPVALGLYAVAQRALNLVLDLLVSNVQRVALPVFSRVAEQPQRLASAYLRATQVTTLAAFPCFTLIAALGPQLMPVVFGAQWLPAGLLMSILALAGMVQSIAFFNNSMMLATGRSRLALGWTATNAVANVAVFAATVHLGITAVAIGFTARAWVMLPVGLYLVRRVSAVSLGDQLRTMGVPALGCSLLALAVVVVHMLWSSDADAFLYLVVAGTVGVIAYLAVVALLRRDLVVAALAVLRSRRRPTDTAHRPVSLDRL